MDKRLIRPLTRTILQCWAVIAPETYSKRVYRKGLNKEIDLKNPRDFNEKIEWLKIYTDTGRWTDLADKYKVRDYVTQCGLGEILVKLYGAWSKAEHIEFDSLPDKFVLKANHGFGKTILVHDKTELDQQNVRAQLNKWLKERYGLISFEPHYWNIQRLIIAEELLFDEYNAAISSSLVDYKITCINGKPEIIVVIAGRENLSVGSNHFETETSGMLAGVYDVNWQPRRDVINAGFFKKGQVLDIPAPQNLRQMIRICEILSKPFPAVRIDLYEVNNKVYFGEITFTPGGNRNYFTDEYFLELGNKIDLSSVKLRTSRYII